jgi:hypothetical protein
VDLIPLAEAARRLGLSTKRCVTVLSALPFQAILKPGDGKKRWVTRRAFDAVDGGIGLEARVSDLEVWRQEISAEVDDLKARVA